MLRVSSLLAALVGLLAAPAHAVPVLDVLSGTDGNYSFSWVHDSTSGNDGQGGTRVGAVDLGAGGGTWVVAAGIGTLDIELTVDVGGSVSTYDATGSFDVAGLSEFATQADVMVGSLAFTLTAGLDDAAVDGVTFYFENRNYGTASSPPNGLAGDVLTLWGASRFTGSGVLGQPLDLVAGGRGLDLRVQFAPPIPEPSARPLYLAGLALVGIGALRRR
jgi:hypothetical protein